MRVDGATVTKRGDLIWIADLPSHWAAKFPSKPAMICEGRSVTYEDFDRGAERLCALWRDAGYQPRDRIGYLGRNSELFYFVFLACARGGFVLTPYNWRYAAPELQFALEDSRPRLLLCDRELTALAQKAMAPIEPKPDFTSIDGDAPSVRAMIEGPPIPQPRRAYAFDDPFLQIYTSGTTGRPKGAVLSHGAMSFARLSYAETPQWENWLSSDVALSAMPSFHTAGIGFCLLTLTVGGTVVQTADPSPANLIKLSNQYHVNRIFMVPTIIRMVLEEIEASGVPAPKYDAVLYGASPIGALQAKAIAAFGCRFTQFYGMTEASGSTHVLGPDDHDPARPEPLKSVGRPMADISMEIRRPDGGLCAMREPGEIWIKSPMMMSGYANRPAETAAALVDGWYRTGDGGFTDEGGYLYLTDRLKEMIISGGENVYPIEVENALRAHPAVQDCAVVGTIDPKWGEAVTAALEFKPGASASFAELRAFVRERLAGFKCPQMIFIADALPRTPTGKLQRGVAKTMLSEFTLLGSSASDLSAKQAS